MRTYLLPIILAGAAALPPQIRAQTPTPAPTPRSPQRAAPSRTTTAEQADAEEEDGVDIVVTGRAPPGAVIGDIPPENQLGPRAIASYGVGTISELLNEIALQTGGADNAPVVLVNGRRISGVNEVSDLPTESVLRIDILPEEVALKYGYSATQKVVNVILRRRFRSIVVNLEGGMSTKGGNENGSGDATWTKIRDNDRINIAARARVGAALFEDQRGILPSATAGFDLTGNIVAPAGGEIGTDLSALAGSTVTIAGVPTSVAHPALSDIAALTGTPNVTDDTAYRTLSPSQRDYSLNATFAHALSKKTTASVNLRVERSTSASERGLPSGMLLLPADNPYSPFTETVGVERYFGLTPLDQGGGSTSAQAGATVNVDFNPKWRLSAIGGYSHNASDTDTDRGYDLAAYQAALAADDPTVSPYGPAPSSLLGPMQTSRARTRSDSGNASALLTGPLLTLPAGPMRMSLRVGGTVNGTTSQTFGAMSVPVLSLSRDTGEGSASIDLPLASKSFVRALGTLTANLNVSRSLVSDFETLDGFGYGLNWTPIKELTLIASVSRSEQAPSLQQLNSPTITTSNVRVFDYVNETTATVTRTSGGNPDLMPSNNRQIRFGATIKPSTKIDLTFTANYTDSRGRNIVGSFPGVSAPLENAFPDRFTRDDDGDLIAVDTRPVNFAQQEERQLRWGFAFTKTLRQPKRPAFNPNFRRPFTPGGAGRPPGAPGGSGAPSGFASPPNNPPLGTDLGQPPEAPPPGAAPPSDGGSGAPDQANGAAPGPGGPDDIVVTGSERDTGGGGATGGLRNGRFGGRGGGGFGRGQFGGSGFRGAGGGGGRGGGGFGGGGFGGGGGGGGRGGLDNSSRLDIAIYHTWILADNVLIREGLPLVDLIHGGTLGGSAQPRHRIEFNAGVSDNGIGIRLSGQWQSGASVDGSSTAGTTSTNGTLHFSPLATFNLRSFINLQQRLPKLKMARGTRLSLSVSNLFDTHQNVTNDLGLTPAAYQSGYVDATGRTVALTLRKIF